MGLADSSDEAEKSQPAQAEKEGEPDQSESAGHHVGDGGDEASDAEAAAVTGAESAAVAGPEATAFTGTEAAAVAEGAEASSIVEASSIAEATAVAEAATETSAEAAIAFVDNEATEAKDGSTENCPDQSV